MGRMASKALTSSRFTHASADCRSEVHLLIVQRNELFARSLARYLSAHYSQILIVGTAADAEARLQNAPETTFHVVCGQTLGPGEPSGAACITHWRALFPAVARASRATGAEHPNEAAPGVDGVFRKPSDPRELLALLRLSALPALQPEPQLASIQKDIMTSNKTKAHDLKTLKERAAVAAASKAGQSAQPKVAQGFTVV